MMRNPNAVHIDFKDLNGLMGKIVPSNIDMVMERNGYFLIGEWKREGEAISVGQNILLKQLAKIADKFTVLIIQGHTDTGSMVVEEFYLMDAEGYLVPIGAGVDKFKDFLVHWKNGVETL